MSKDIEKRKHDRINVKFIVECRSQHIWQNAQGCNISQGGVFIATDKIEPAGTDIDVIFEFGKDPKRTIQAKARVAWIRSKPEQDQGGNIFPPGMGLQFIRISPQDGEQFLKQIIEQWGTNE